MENERSVHFEQLLKGRFPLTHYFYVLRDRPLEKLWGGGFSSRRNFFRYQIPCMNFFLGHSMNIF